MKIQKSTLISLIILSASLIIISCNTTEKTTQSNSDEITGQLIKETAKIKGCLYSDGSICNQTCCKTGNSCGDQPYSYKKCDISKRVWDFTQYKNIDCSGSCVISSVEKSGNKKEGGEEIKKEPKVEIANLTEEQKKGVVEIKLPEAEKVTCTLNTLECNGNWLKKCNSDGSGWNNYYEFCSYGCSNGLCNKGCTAGYLNEYKCEDKLLYQNYIYSDCTTRWSLKGYCSYGCIDGKCLPKNKVAEPVQEPTPLASNVVPEVTDGDTIKLQSGEKVRLIGINTPESGQYYYSEAKNKLKEFVEGKTIKLEKDISNTDVHDRLLRYIYVDNLFVNLEMIKLGYAEAYKYPPDVKYANLFEEAENEAKTKGLGIWKTDTINYIVDKCFNIINFHYNAAGNDNYNLNDEYFTLKNSCSYLIDLTGWTIKDEATHIYKFNNFNLGANVQVTIYTGSGQDTSTELYWGKTSAVWNNDGDTLFLRDKNGNFVLEEKY